VKRIADEHERHRGAMNLAFIGMAMTKQDQLLEDEEGQDAGQQRAEDGRRSKRIERFRQQREERDAEECADRVADQPRHEARPHLLCEQEQRTGHQQAAAAAKKAETQCGGEQRHGVS